MKTIPPPCPEPATGPKYWRSLEELAETPEFRQWVEREFPQGASEFTDPVSRRHFVKIMSASFLLAGLGITGCRRPEEKIFPFGKQPENYIHGVPQLYATAMPTRGGAIPLLARSNDGRPTKVEGNPQHPDSNGGTDIFAQASVLNLYDPDRAQRFTRNGSGVSREEAFDFLAATGNRFAAAGGEGLSFLMERSSSPSRGRLQGLLSQKFPKARWFIYEPVDFDVHAQVASSAAGAAIAPYFKLDKAKVILSLDCDFIGAEEETWRFIRGFSKGRKMEKPSDPMNRLYVVEGLMTQTGINADHRLRIAPGAVIAIAAALAEKIASSAEVQALAKRFPLPSGVKPEWIAECASDLLANKGAALVLAGHRQPPAVHVIANVLNAALQNVGQTVVYHQAPASNAAGIADLADALNKGQVDTLLILGANPAYTASANLNWPEAQKKAKTVIRLGYYEDETFAGSTWHLPAAHYLESWGDARTSDGTLVSIQPLIEPLFGGITEIEVLARLGVLGTTRAHDIVRDTFKTFAGPDALDDKWKKFLHDGFLPGTPAPPVTAVQFSAENIGKLLGSAAAVPPPSKDKLEVVFHRDYKVDDGRYTNNGWLQEMPDPVTKIVWENVILMSNQTAKDLGLVIKDKEDNNLQVPLVKITLDGREVEGPAWVQPGMADNVIGLALGYGRSHTGRIGNGSGYNAYRLRTSANPYIASGATLTPLGKKHKLSTTQNHWTMEGRPIIREGNLKQYQDKPNFAKGMNMHEPPGPKDKNGHPVPLYPNPLDVPDASGKSPRDQAVHWWGMSIDLNSCVGCSACIMACQSENNIPIVGKDQISRNREMLWIRIDRYYTGTVEDPQAVHQPMLCQHCEAAPCENVCPVNATVHDNEGLNVMAYNRCVGTRYCSNNCPYKVRRFNYLDYNRRPLDKLVGPVYSTPLLNSVDGEWELARWWRDPDRGIRPEDEWELLKLVKNPDVTVRMRGVMEKCTFCIQRIEQAKIAQKVKAGASPNIEVPDGTIKTACQQACPAEAIVFGNMKDPNSRVSQLKKQERDYSVLEFLATKPRVTYLARVRNPNPKMPDYYEKPLSFVEWEEKGNSLDPGAGHNGAGAPGAEKKGAH